MKYLLDTAPMNVVVTLITADRDLGDSEPYAGLSGVWREYGRHRIYYFNWRNPRHWARLVAAIRREAADMLYLNSSFSPIFSIIPLCLHRLRILRTGSVLVAPRGEFSPGALNIKSIKKRTYIRVTRRLLYSSRILWHASTELEATNIRRIHADATILSSIDSVGDTPIDHVVASKDVARLVFIGRISPKKNLTFALSILERTRIPVIFDIYGPLEDLKYWGQCLEVISRLPPQTEVRYRGELSAELVRPIFSHYDAFIFPTFGENFGHVIPEALSSGCPVFCSDQTPWSGLLNRGGGSAIPLASVGLWEDCLKTLAQETSQERTGRRLTALQTYAESWSRLRQKNVLGEAAALLISSRRSPRRSA